MRSFLVVLCLLISTSSAFASSRYGAASYNERYTPANQYNDDISAAAANARQLEQKANRPVIKDYEINVGLEGGYRTSELVWNIPGAPPVNVLSELKWENISGYQIEPKIEYNQKTGLLKGLNIQASINKSITTSGENQDSDYDGANRTLEWSRSNNSSNAGHAEGFSASIGYAFNFGGNRERARTRFTTLVGYAIQNQQFVQRDGFQTIWTDDPSQQGPFYLNSSYDMQLYMPFIGAELTSYFYDSHQLKISGRYSKASYVGTGHWNQRTDFAHPDSFVDNVDGIAFLLGAEYAWEFYPQTQFTLSSHFNYFNGKDGYKIQNASDGSVTWNYVNEATWHSLDYMAGLNYKF